MNAVNRPLDPSFDRDDLLARLEAGEDFDEAASAALVELLEADPTLAADIDGEVGQLRELAPDLEVPALDEGMTHDVFGRILAELATDGTGNGTGQEHGTGHGAESGGESDTGNGTGEPVETDSTPDASSRSGADGARPEPAPATPEPPPDNPFGWLLSLGFGVLVIGFLAAIETTPVHVLPVDGGSSITSPGSKTDAPKIVPDEFMPKAEVIVEDLVTADGVDAMMSPSFGVGGEFLIIWLDPDEAR